MKLYVGNLAYKTDEETLRKAFEQYGEVLSANIVMDKETGRSRGFGFVELADEQALAAISALNGAELDGRNIKVSESKPQERRGGRGFGDSRRGGGNRNFAQKRF